MIEEGKNPITKLSLDCKDDGTDNIYIRHFYAYEKPELLVRDLNAMFGKSGAGYGVILERNGY